MNYKLQGKTAAGEIVFWESNVADWLGVDAPESVTDVAVVFQPEAGSGGGGDQTLNDTLVLGNKADGVNIIMNSGAEIITEDSTGDSDAISISTGDSTSGSGGGISIQTGGGTVAGGDLEILTGGSADKTGSIDIRTASGGVDNGMITIAAGGYGTGLPGDVRVHTGGVSNQTEAANFILEMGTGGTGGYTQNGSMWFKAQRAVTNLTKGGDGYFWAGDVINGVGGTGGHIGIKAGSVESGTGKGGDLAIAAGNGNSGLGGSLELSSGSSEANYAGPLNITGGHITNSPGNQAGSITIKSGNVISGSGGGGALTLSSGLGQGGGDSGVVNLTSTNSNSTGDSGQININSGSGTSSGSSSSGDVRISTGIGSVASGDIRILTNSSTGTRGSVYIQDIAYPSTDGTAGQAIVTDGLGNLSFADAAGSGETNTASNAGIGESLVLPKSGVDLPFKGLTSGVGITLTPTATDIQISADVDVISQSGVYGEMYIASGDSAETIIANANTPVKILGTTTSGQLNDFEMSTDNRLTYVGGAATEVIVSTAVTLSKALSGVDVYTIYIYKNGVQVDKSAFSREFDGTDSGSMSTQAILPCVPGDYFEAWVECDGTDNITAVQMSTIISISGAALSGFDYVIDSWEDLIAASESDNDDGYALLYGSKSYQIAGDIVVPDGYHIQYQSGTTVQGSAQVSTSIFGNIDAGTGSLVIGPNTGSWVLNNIEVTNAGTGACLEVINDSSNFGRFELVRFSGLGNLVEVTGLGSVAVMKSCQFIGGVNQVNISSVIAGAVVIDSCAFGGGGINFVHVESGTTIQTLECSLIRIFGDRPSNAWMLNEGTISGLIVRSSEPEGMLAGISNTGTIGSSQIEGNLFKSPDVPSAIIGISPSNQEDGSVYASFHLLSDNKWSNDLGDYAQLIESQNYSNLPYAVAVESGASTATNNTINFIEGSNVSIAVSDNAGTTDVTISATGSGGSGDVGFDYVIASKQDLLDASTSNTVNGAIVMPAGSYLLVGDINLLDTATSPASGNQDYILFSGDVRLVGSGGRVKYTITGNSSNSMIETSPLASFVSFENIQLSGSTVNASAIQLEGTATTNCTVANVTDASGWNSGQPFIQINSGGNTSISEIVCSGGQSLVEIDSNFNNIVIRNVKRSGNEQHVINVTSAVTGGGRLKINEVFQSEATNSESVYIQGQVSLVELIDLTLNSIGGSGTVSMTGTVTDFLIRDCYIDGSTGISVSGLSEMVKIQNCYLESGNGIAKSGTNINGMMITDCTFVSGSSYNCFAGISPDDAQGTPGVPASPGYPATPTAGDPPPINIGNNSSLTNPFYFLRNNIWRNLAGTEFQILRESYIQSAFAPPA